MTAPEGQPPPPTHIAGYRVERVLAVTAMATVYLVHSPTLPRREVLKVLQPEHANGDHVRAQFLHEADITAGIAIDFMKPSRVPLPEDFVHIRRWHGEVSARPSWKA